MFIPVVLEEVAVAPSGRSSLTVAVASAATRTLAAAMISTQSTTHLDRPPNTGGPMVSLLYHMILATHLIMSPYQ